MKLIVVIIGICSLLDALFTDFGIAHGYIKEANPLMNYIYIKHYFYFYVFKVVLPLIYFWIIMKLKTYSWHLKLFTVMCLLFYVGILVLHSWWIVKVI